MLASSFYKLIKILEYESANPDQDAMERKKDEHEAKTGHRPSNASTLSPTLNGEGTGGGAGGGEGAGFA